MTVIEEARRNELAAFLRSRRDRITPEAVGLPVVGRRRAPGLRREEVAQLAGVGVTWYTWLEQGRSINVSPQVLGGIARALRLDAEETDHLFTLGGHQAPQPLSENQITEASLAAILKAVAPLPAYALSARYDLFAWNDAALVLFGDLPSLPPEDRNVVWLLFTDPAWRLLLNNGADRAECVARLRRQFASHVGEPEWEELIDRLRHTSRDFCELWQRHEIGRAAVPKVKHLNHPEFGEFDFAATSLWLADQPGSRLVIYTPMDARGHEIIACLNGRAPWAAWADRIPQQV